MSSQPFHFYLLETHSEPSFGNKGKFFLIGKVLRHGKPANCTITLVGLPKYLYFLRHDYDYPEYPGIMFPRPIVNEEIAKFLHSNNITQFTSKFKWMRYLFSEEYPFQGNYTEVKVPVNSLKNFDFLHNYKGNQYFKLLCPKMSLLETFQYTYQVKSNCWLSFENNPKVNIYPGNNYYLEFNMSSGNITITVINNKPPPSLILATLRIIPSVDKNGNEEISCISCMAHQYQFPWQDDSRTNIINESCQDLKKSFTLLRGPSNTPQLPCTTSKSIESDERSLIKKFTTSLLSINPDIIVAHDWYGHDSKLLSDRMHNYGLTTSTELSRVRRMLNQPGSAQFIRERKITLRKLFPEMLLTGRIVCDLRIRCQDSPNLIGIDLPSLTTQLLGETPSLKDFCTSADFADQQTILDLTAQVKKQVEQVLQITMNQGILPNSYKLSTLHCCFLNNTLRYSKLFRTESMITFEFFANRTMLPVFGYKPRCEDRMLEGGMVLHPITGLFQTIVICLDFKALYPSIIVEDRLCFEDNYVRTNDGNPAGGPHPKSFTLLPALAKCLLTARELCQQPQTSTNNSPTTLATNDTFTSLESNSYKLAGNCLFGGLASRLSKFYSQRVAEAITERGRRLLEALRIQIECVLGHRVIYGDTDSVFVETGLAGGDFSRDNWARANEVVKSVMDLVDSWDKGQFQLKCDGVYSNFLMLKKKSYCGTKWTKNADGTDEFTIHYTGMDCTRRDYPLFCNDILKTTIASLLNSREVSQTVRNRWLLDISEAITKLTATPKDPNRDLECLLEEEDDWTIEQIEKICNDPKLIGEGLEETNKTSLENDNDGDSDTTVLMSSDNEPEEESNVAKRLAEEMSPSVIKPPEKKRKSVSTKSVYTSDSDYSDVVCIDDSPDLTEFAQSHSNSVNPAGTCSFNSRVRSETSRRAKKQSNFLFKEITGGGLNFDELMSTCQLNESVTISRVTPPPVGLTKGRQPVKGNINRTVKENDVEKVEKAKKEVEKRRSEEKVTTKKIEKGGRSVENVAKKKVEKRRRSVEDKVAMAEMAKSRIVEKVTTKKIEKGGRGVENVAKKKVEKRRRSVEDKVAMAEMAKSRIVEKVTTKQSTSIKKVATKLVSNDSDNVCTDHSPNPTKSAPCRLSSLSNPPGTSLMQTSGTAPAKKVPMKQTKLSLTNTGNWKLDHSKSDDYQGIPIRHFNSITYTIPTSSTTFRTVKVLIDSDVICLEDSPPPLVTETPLPPPPILPPPPTVPTDSCSYPEVISLDDSPPPPMTESPPTVSCSYPNIICLDDSPPSSPPVTEPPTPPTIVPTVSCSYPALFTPADCQPFVMRMQLNRELTGYGVCGRSGGESAHVTAAVRYNTHNSDRRPFKKGDIVPYVICRDDSDLSPAMSAYHPDDYVRCGFPIDLDYYIKKKLYPSLQHIFTPISSPLRKLTDEDLMAVLAIKTNSNVNNNKETYRNPAILNILEAYSKLAIIEDTRPVNIEPLARLNFEMSSLV